MDLNTNNTELNAALQFGADPSLPNHPAWDRLSWGVNVLQDLARSLQRWKRLTPKQSALAIKIHKDSLQRMQWAEQRVQEREHRVAAGIRAPQGRAEVSGVILTIKEKQTDFGEVTKCLIKLSDGAKVWGTMPNDAFPYVIGENVTFVATFKPSDDDPTFAFYSRPAKWREAA